MVLHTDSAFSSMTGTTAASSAASSRAASPDYGRLMSHRRAPELVSRKGPHYRFGKPPKNIYAVGEEQISQEEWETLNAKVRKQLRAVELIDTIQQRMAIARLNVCKKDFTDPPVYPERHADYFALKIIAAEGRAKHWKRPDGWKDLAHRCSPAGIPEEGALAACAGVVLKARRPPGARDGPLSGAETSSARAEGLRLARRASRDGLLVVGFEQTRDAQARRERRHGPRAAGQRHGQGRPPALPQVLGPREPDGPASGGAAIGPKRDGPRRASR